ncbi:tyrosine-type recombinase/integrase [Methanobacterium sp. ACI-7]|uniref:tyrosine-type recombinase/integrase n=1 Tax=unclassified Methanobacterium TaxID=2627676 RepID=UPI0039C1FB42
MDIHEDTTLLEFLDSRNTKESTKEIYIRRIVVYCKFIGKTPTELIEEAEKEEEKRIRMRNRKIKRYFINYIKHMKEERKSPNYVSAMMTTIRSFYSSMEIELPNVSCNIKETEQLVTTNDIPSKKHIRKALKYSNIKYRAIILLMMSSGMGNSEIRNLTLKDYLESLKITNYDLSNTDELLNAFKSREKEIPTWSIRRIKTGMPYVTFSSPESVKAINDYIDERYEKGKDFKTIDDYLFENLGNKMKKRTLIANFSRLNDLCGFGKFKRQRFFRSHALRKYFASTIKNNGMDNLTSEWLIGHKINSITDAYIKPDIYRMKKDYLDVLPHLSLEEIEIKTVHSPEYKELLDKNIVLVEQIDSMSERYEEKLAEIEKELEFTKKHQGRIQYKLDKIDFQNIGETQYKSELLADNIDNKRNGRNKPKTKDTE